MPVPDSTYFGDRPEGGPITYGEVRAITDDQRKLEILKARLHSFLVKQNGQIAIINEDGHPKIWSPFSLCILTLLAIETLGRLVGDVDKIRAESDNEQSKKLVTPIYRLMDKRLSDKPSKKFYEAFADIHGTDDKKSIKKYSDVIHKYQRNTFNHGYQAKGVFLDHTLTNFWTLHELEGFMVINPYKFWNRFTEVFEDIFRQILSDNNASYQTNALKYFETLLK